jgi:hypothetical protein
VLTGDTASTRTIDSPARLSPGCVNWQIMRRTLWRADFDDARHPNTLPLKKARPGQRRHSGPRCLSPDISKWPSAARQTTPSTRTWHGGENSPLWVVGMDGRSTAKCEIDGDWYEVIGECRWTLGCCQARLLGATGVLERDRLQ